MPQPDYSWMAYLANAGFDVFAMDTTGYGRSTRPAAMNDPCNLAKDRQGAFVPSLIPAPCAPSYPHALTTIASDWNDIDGVVNYIRALRHVDKVSLLAWSLGGPRAGGYAAQHPEKVQKLVLLAPAYSRNASPTPPAKMPPDGVADEHAVARRVLRQLGSPGRLPGAVRPRGRATPCGRRCSPPIRSARPGARACAARRRRRPGAGTPRRSAKTQTPTLMIAGQHDKQVPPERVRELYADLARAAEAVRRSRVLVAQRDVGEEPPADVPGVARLADDRIGERDEGRHAAPGLLMVARLKRIGARLSALARAASCVALPLVATARSRRRGFGALRLRRSARPQLQAVSRTRPTTAASTSCA